MVLFVMLTGLGGFAASAVMLHAGVSSMGWRYLAAFATAYAFFLVLLWLWLRTGSDDYVDLAGQGWSPGSGPGGHFHGGGGGSGGGGASGGWDSASSGGSDLGGAGDLLGAADELALPLFVFVLLAVIASAAVAAAGILIWTAPSLFAEITVDSALACSLYRRLQARERDRQHWLDGAIRRTWWPFAITATVVAVAAALLQHAAPQATTLWEALAALRAPA